MVSVLKRPGYYEIHGHKNADVVAFFMACLLIISGAGHDAMFANLGESNEALRSFLGRFE